MSFLNSAESSTLLPDNSIASTLAKWFMTIETVGREMQMQWSFSNILEKGLRGSFLLQLFEVNVMKQ